MLFSIALEYFNTTITCWKYGKKLEQKLCSAISKYGCKVNKCLYNY